jgi:hypothetical protein
MRCCIPAACHNSSAGRPPALSPEIGEKSRPSSKAPSLIIVHRICLVVSVTVLRLLLSYIIPDSIANKSAVFFMNGEFIVLTFCYVYLTQISETQPGYEEEVTVPSADISIIPHLSLIQNLPITISNIEYLSLRII